MEEASAILNLSASEVLRQFRDAPVVSWTYLTGGKPILVIAPHADDETLGCGGLIAQTAARGITVTVALLTDGIRSHLGSKSNPPSVLKQLRERELQDALLCLGAENANIIKFEQPDGFLSSNGAESERIVEHLVRHIRNTGIGSLFVTWAADPHPDHLAATHLARQICRSCPKLGCFSYPIWGLTLKGDTVVTADYAASVRLNISNELAEKRKAIAAYKSQTTRMIADAEDAFLLTDEHIRLFCAEFETFIPMQSERSSDALMAPLQTSVPTAHFDKLYASSTDPWGYETCDYEIDKYANTVRLLPRNRYKRGLELGCSIGVLTESLAAHCDELLGVDCSQRAIDAAKTRLQAHPHVRIHQMRAPAQMPEGTFDLIVLSEVLYFFADHDLDKISQFVIDRLRPGGTCIVVNFLGDTQAVRSGDASAAYFLAATRDRLVLVGGERHEHYRIDIMTTHRQS